MKENDPKADPARGFAAAAVYCILSDLLLPVTPAGYVIWIGKALLAGRGSGVSGTAQGPLSARFFEHQPGVREDDPAYRLMTALPNVPHLGLRLFAGPMLLAYRATGYVPKAFRYPFEGEILPQYQASARMTFFDAAVERYLGGITQFVILGAGFDTRAFRLPRDARVCAFEVDAPKTQAVKRAALQKAGRPGRRHLRGRRLREGGLARAARGGRFRPRPGAAWSPSTTSPPSRSRRRRSIGAARERGPPPQASR